MVRRAISIPNRMPRWPANTADSASYRTGRNGRDIGRQFWPRRNYRSLASSAPVRVSQNKTMFATCNASRSSSRIAMGRALVV